MKRFVNGIEAELRIDPEISVKQHGDRLIVHGPRGAETAAAVRDGDAVLISYRGRQFKVEKAARRAQSGAKGSGSITAPMPGLIVDVLVAEGDHVEKGQKLVVLEAMKTQQAFVAPFTGVVKAVLAQSGQQVVDGQLLAEVEGE